MAYGVVYGLYDPRTNELRYIGQTTNPLRVRMSAAKNGKTSAFKGKRHTAATKEKIRVANAARTPEQRMHHKHLSTPVVLERVASGHSYRRIAEEFGVSANCIGERVRKAAARG